MYLLYVGIFFKVMGVETRKQEWKWCDRAVGKQASREQCKAVVKFCGGWTGSVGSHEIVLHEAHWDSRTLPLTVAAVLSVCVSCCTI